MAVDARRFVSFFLQGTGQATETDWQPATDIYRIPSGWLVKIELAGVTADDVQLTLKNRTLIVRGRRRDHCPAEACQTLHMEIAYSRFERRIELPAELDVVSLETSFRDGMLLIKIHREARS